MTLAAWVSLALEGDLPTWFLLAAGGLLLLFGVQILWLSHQVRRDERRDGPP